MVPWTSTRRDDIIIIFTQVFLGRNEVVVMGLVAGGVDGATVVVVSDAAVATGRHKTSGLQNCIMICLQSCTREKINLLE